MTVIIPKQSTIALENRKINSVSRHHRYAANGFKLQVGAGIEYAHYDNTTARRLFAAGAIDQYYSRALNMWKWAVFGQVSPVFSPNGWLLSLGLRADGCNYTGKTAALYRQNIAPFLIFLTHSTNAGR